MFRFFCIIIFLIISKLTYGQLTNLIPNGSFELNTPVYDPLCDTLFYIENIPNWERGNVNMNQYFTYLNNACNFISYPTPFEDVRYHGVPYNEDGYEFAKDGIAYMGITLYSDTLYVNDDRGIIKAMINAPLQTNHKYCLSFWVSSFDCAGFSTSSVGALFTDTAFFATVNNSIPVQVQNTSNNFINFNGWQLISSSFIASGNEQYLSIGNFNSIDSTSIVAQEIPSICYNNYIFSAGVFIDDVSLYDCTGFYYEAEAGENRDLCKGEETTLGWDENTARTFKWSVVSGDSASLTNDSLPRPTVSPQQTTVYALYVVDEYVQEHFDTVTVEVIDCENPIYLPNIFSPNNDGNNDVYYVRSSYVKELKAMRLYDRWGEEVFSCNTSTPLSATSTECGWDGTFRGHNAPEGVYAVFVEALLLNGETVVKSGTVTLVR